VIEEDYQAWEAYPQYRWVFNKLEMALRLGYRAGPAATSVTEPGYYVIRPIYNLYGMGIGASVVYLDPDQDREAMLNHAYCAPGTFWCEYFDGVHQSVDFNRINGEWVARSATIGSHRSTDNLVEFDSWIKITPTSHIADSLPGFIHDIGVPHMNIEYKGDKIIEVHLRLGNDPFDQYPIGTHIIPVWEGGDYSAYERAPNWKFIGNMHDDLETYRASGLIKRARLGYYVSQNLEVN